MHTGENCRRKTGRTENQECSTVPSSFSSRQSERKAQPVNSPSGAKHTTSTGLSPRNIVISWEVIDRPHPYGNPTKRLRICVTYQGGRDRLLPVAFPDPTELSEYVSRVHPEFEGKEALQPKKE